MNRTSAYDLVYWHISLQWRYNGRDGVSSHQPHDCLLNRLFKAQIKEISKLRVTVLYEGNSPVTDEFSAQRVSNTEIFPSDDAIMYQSLDQEVLAYHAFTDEPWGVCCEDLVAITSSPPGQNGRHFGRRQFQMHFCEWKW